MNTFVKLALVLLSALPWPALQNKTEPKAAAEEKKAAKPALKPEVALGIRTEQVEQAKLIIQMAQLQQQFAQLQQQSMTRGQNIKAQMDNAIERSGLDPKKYDLNQDTLELTEKPQPTPEPEKPAEGKP